MIHSLFRAAVLVAILSLWRALSETHGALVAARVDALRARGEAERWRRLFEAEHARAEMVGREYAGACKALDRARAEHAVTKNALGRAAAGKDEANGAWQNERGRVVNILAHLRATLGPALVLDGEESLAEAAERLRRAHDTMALQVDAVHAALGGGEGEPLVEVVDRARRAAENGEEWRGEAYELRGRLNAVRVALGLAADRLPASAEVDPLEARMLRAEREGHERRRQARAQELSEERDRHERERAALNSALATARAQLEETVGRLERLTWALKAKKEGWRNRDFDLAAAILDEAADAPSGSCPACTEVTNTGGIWSQKHTCGRATPTLTIESRGPSLPSAPGCLAFVALDMGAPATPTDADRCVCGATRGEHRAAPARAERTREERIDAAVRAYLLASPRSEVASLIAAGADGVHNVRASEIRASLARLGAVEYEGRWTMAAAERADSGPVAPPADENGRTTGERVVDAWYALANRPSMEKANLAARINAVVVAVERDTMARERERVTLAEQREDRVGALLVQARADLATACAEAERHREGRRIEGERHSALLDQRDAAWSERDAAKRERDAARAEIHLRANERIALRASLATTMDERDVKRAGAAEWKVQRERSEAARDAGCRARVEAEGALTEIRRLIAAPGATVDEVVDAVRGLKADYDGAFANAVVRAAILNDIRAALGCGEDPNLLEAVRALRAGPPDPTTGDGWRALLADLRARAGEAARRAAEADQARAKKLDDAARAALAAIASGGTWQELHADVERRMGEAVGKDEFRETMRRVGVTNAADALKDSAS